MKGYLLSAIVLVAFSFSSCKKVVVSCFGVSSYAVKVGEPVVFTNCSTNGESYIWSFGDGATSTESAPTHTYTRLGTYEVTMTAISKKDKGSDEQTLTIQVLPNVNNADVTQSQQYRLTYFETMTRRVYDNVNDEYNDVTTRDTMVTDTYFSFSEDGSTIYFDIETILGDCEAAASLSGDNFTLPSQTNFVCQGNTWQGLAFGGLTGSFSDLGRSVSFNYQSTQTLDATTTGVLSLGYTITGLRIY